ncbi:MAG: crossover junction endodeoxyribonuclease RuvC [bacterium]|nr:crossover junction endodeoxyribonuclease RuvC [bacterium]
MIILGIDPGTTRIGFGVIDNTKNKLSCIRYGILEQLSPAGVMSELGQLIQNYKPDVAAVEKLFFFKNKKTIISVSEMRGIIMATLAMNNVPTREFTPLQVKQAVSSYGRADKDQVERMVRLILNLKEVVKPDDAADGLAIAICCANNIVYQAK